MHFLNKQLRKKELLMQPMDNINPKDLEPSNPLREKYSDLVIRLHDKMNPEEMEEINQF